MFCLRGVINDNNAVLNTLTMGTAFPRDSPRNDPCAYRV